MSDKQIQIMFIVTIIFGLLFTGYNELGEYNRCKDEGYPTCICLTSGRNGQFENYQEEQKYKERDGNVICNKN